MASNRRMELGILASIFTGTVSTILGAIILQWFAPPSSGSQSDKPPAIENKPAPPKVDLAPRDPTPRDPAPRDPTPCSQALLGNTPQEAELPGSAREEDREAELRNGAFPSRAWERERQALRDQLAASKEKMDVLKRTIDGLERHANTRKDSETNRPIRVSTPQPAPVLLYYRVASQRTRQVEDAHIDEVTHFLKSMNLSYVRGRSWKDSGLSPLWVPIAIHKTSSWRSYGAKTVAHRDRIRDKMLALGIETRIDKPEEIDD